MSQTELQMALAANEILYRRKLVCRELYEGVRERLTARILRPEAADSGVPSEKRRER